MSINIEMAKAYLNGKTIQYKLSGLNEWNTFESVNETGILPGFHNDYEYRIKPDTIMIGEYEVPAPCTEPLEKGTYYYVANPVNNPQEFYWAGDSIDNELLQNGLIHLTKEAAQEHIDALLSFTSRV